MLLFKVLLLGKTSLLKEQYFRKLLALKPEEKVDIKEVDFYSVSYSEKNTGVALNEPFQIQLINVPNNLKETVALKQLYQASDYFLFFCDDSDASSKSLLTKTLLPDISQKVLLSKDNCHISCVYERDDKKVGSGIRIEKKAGVDIVMVDMNQDGLIIRQQLATALERCFKQKGLMDDVLNKEGCILSQDTSSGQYEKYWDGTMTVRHNMIVLLNNYANGDLKLGFITHPYRKHKLLALKIAGQLERDEINELDAFNTLADEKKEPNGSLHRRVAFLREKLKNDLLIDPSSLHVSNVEKQDEKNEENKGWLGFGSFL